MNSTAARTGLVAVGEISAMLGAQALSLVHELLPNGRRDGGEWRCGSLAGEPGSSCAVHLFGAKAGVWSDFASGERGDALDLVAQCLFQGDKRQALQWARRWLGLDSSDPAKLAITRRVVQEREQRAEEETTKARNSAFRLWTSAEPRLAGTPVEYYLAGRGIDLASLGRQPRAIRFHPALFNVERQAPLSAMVTFIGDGNGNFIACHRTWLEQAGPNDWRKARLEKPKMVLGAFKGGYIRLWRGASGKPLAEAADGETVDVTEGIEDGLSVAVAFPESRVVAAVSLSNMANLVFPPCVRAVHLWRQNDKNPAAISAFHKAMEGFVKRRIKVVIPEIPPEFKDVNDLLQAG